MQKWRKLLRGPFSQLFLPYKGITILFSLVDKQKASVGVLDSTSNMHACIPKYEQRPRSHEWRFQKFAFSFH